MPPTIAAPGPQPINPRPLTESRALARYPVALPITLEGEEGQTLDLSAQGVLFESAARPEVGSHVSLAIHYQVGDTPLVLDCDGEVVRVECHGSACNIAVRLRRPLFR